MGERQDSYTCNLLRVENPLSAKCLCSSCDSHLAERTGSRNGCLLSPRTWVSSFPIEIVNGSQLQTYACKLLRVQNPIYAKCLYHLCDSERPCSVSNACCLLAAPGYLILRRNCKWKPIAYAYACK